MTSLATGPSTLTKSERSGCVLSVYGLAKRGLSFFSRGLGPGAATALPTDGTDPSGAILANCSTATSLGGGSQWQASLKYDASSFDPLASIEVGSWVYISMVRFGVSWLVLCGRLTDVRVSEQATGQGVTVRVCTLAGLGFESIWRETMWWFSSITRDVGVSSPSVENLGNSEVIRAIGVDRLLGNPAQNVEHILVDFLRIMGAKGRANFQMPSSMPGVSGNAADIIQFDDTGYDTKTIPRFSPTASNMFPNVDLWSMAQEYQDAMFCEMWADVLPTGGFPVYAQDPGMESGLSPLKAELSVVFRDKPFPLSTGAASPKSGLQSPYYALPTHTVRRADVASLDLGVSSVEVFNSFSFTGAGVQEAQRQFIDLQYCNWSVSDMARRGMRKLPASSQYYNRNAFSFYDYQRKRIRDWYCLGAELLQGTLTLARGYPQIKVGSRISVLGPQPSDRVTFYVESVRNSWAPQGMRTMLDVTRGFRGTDKAMQARLDSAVLDYGNSI